MGAVEVERKCLDEYDMMSLSVILNMWSRQNGSLKRNVSQIRRTYLRCVSVCPTPFFLLLLYCVGEATTIYSTATLFFTLFFFSHLSLNTFHFSCIKRKKIHVHTHTPFSIFFYRNSRT